MYSFVEINVGSRRQSGFTLIELMVALVLGLLVVLGATQLFLTSSQSFRSIEDVNKRQEVVSYISNIIGYEFRVSVSGSGPVASGSEDVVNQGDRLKIEFSGDKYKPYCPSGTSEMNAIGYYLDGQALMIEAQCDGFTQAAQEVITGISEVMFKSEKINGSDAYVDVILTLESPGSSSLSDVVSMRFARHSKRIFE